MRSRTHPDTNAPSLTHTPSLIPSPFTTPVKEALPTAEITPEPEVPIVAQNDVNTIKVEGHTIHTITPDTHAPKLSTPLDPSRTVTIPPHSFSDIQTSLTLATYTEETLHSSFKGATLDPISTPPLQAVSILEMQQTSSDTLILTFSIPPQPVVSEMTPPAVVVPPVMEQPVQLLPTPSRPEALITPPTELPAVLRLTDTHTDIVMSGADSSDIQKYSVQASQPSREQGDSVTHTAESHRAVDVVDEELLSTNGTVHRSATDFYAELQNGGDYNGAVINGNVLLNGGAMHGSNQKESVFMRLNNRIKALEMNMSLSSRYLEELSQR